MIYLDNAAIQRPKPECINISLSVWQNNWGNPSSIYEFGAESRQIVERSRELIAKEINCSPDEIIFCSSGSEANTLAINGYLEANDRAVCGTTKIEHPSILENPNIISNIIVDREGFINRKNFVHNAFYSIQFANSEIGTIQDIKSISRKIHEAHSILHCDATQAFGHVPIDVKELGVDMLTASGQKIGSVPGCAFLYVRKGIKLSPIIYGHQENGLRAGTENVAAIASLGKAVELIDYDKQVQIGTLRNELFYKLKDVYGDDIKLNGTDDMSKRIPNNLSILFKPNYTSESIITLLSLQNIYISAGSACSAGTGEPSKTLKAIGLSDEECGRVIRITLGEDTTKYDLVNFVSALKKVTDRLEQFSQITILA